MWIQICSRWLWSVLYSGCSTLKIRESFSLFLANQCNGTKSFDNSMHNSHPAIFFNQNCGWYETSMFLAHLINMCYKLNATIAWRPRDLSLHSLVEYYSSLVNTCWWESLLHKLSCPLCSSSAVASFGDSWHRFGMFGTASWLCFNIALPWVKLCQEFYKSLKQLRNL